MKSLVHAKISELWQALPGTPLGNPVRLYSMNSVGVGTIPAQPEKPFAVIKEGLTIPILDVGETSDAERIPYEIYLYDDHGSMRRLTAILRTLQSLVKALPGQASPTGAFCLGATWGGLSQDLFDPTYEASMRFASFVLTATHHEEA